MADWTGFRIAPPCLLRASGEFVGPDETAADPTAAREIVLGRALCHFEAYPARAGLEGAQLERAARLHASAHGPFPSSDFALYRHRLGVAIWYWDRGKVEEALAGRREYRGAHFRPEGAAPAYEDGAFLIARSEGREAQLWQSGTLVSSLWRRRPFTAAQWSDFTGVDADSAPLEQTVDPYSERTRGRIHAPATWRTLEQAAMAGATLVVAVAAFFLGQFVAIENEVARARSRVEAGIAASDPSVRRDMALVRAYAEAAPSVQHLLTSTEALDALDELGLSPSRWSVTEGRFEATFPDMSAADLATAATRLEVVPTLIQVRARRETGGRATVISAGIARSPRHGP